MPGTQKDLWWFLFFVNFLLLYFFFFIWFFLRIFNRSAATCGGGYRRCSSCVLIDAYKVLECGQHLNQSMVPLMLNARDSFRVSPIKLLSLRERQPSPSALLSSSAYLFSLASLSILSFTFFLSLSLSALSLGPPSLFVSSLSYVPKPPFSLHVSNERSRTSFVSTKRKSSLRHPGGDRDIALMIIRRTDSLVNNRAYPSFALPEIHDRARKFRRDKPRT